MFSRKTKLCSYNYEIEFRDTRYTKSWRILFATTKKLAIQLSIGHLLKLWIEIFGGIDILSYILILR